MIGDYVDSKLNNILLDILIENRKINSVTKCWIYTGKTDKDWYGIIYFDRKKYKVHRLIAYFCLNFNLDSELLVCHKCDVPRCFNPIHLFIGTNQDNTDDMMKKNRHHEAKQTTCSEGHLFDRIYGRKRHCSICDIERNRVYRENLKKDKLKCQ